MQIQTIIKDVEELKSIDEDGNFTSTSFDDEVASFISGIIENDHYPMSVSYLSESGKVIAIITYAEMTQEMKMQNASIKSGISLAKDFKA